MTQEEFDNLKIGDLVISPIGNVYIVVHFSDGPIVARHASLSKLTACPRHEKPLSDAAATALALDGKDIHSKYIHSKSDTVVIVLVTEDYELNVHGAINDFASTDNEHAAELRINQDGLIELPGTLNDESDEGVTEMRDHCNAWLSSPSIILDPEGNLSGTAVDLGYKFRQANGRAGVCIDLDRLPKGKS